MKGFIVQPTYRVLEDKTYIQLYGRLENGESFVTNHKFEPYFFIKTEDFKKAKSLVSKFDIEDTKLTNFKEEKVTKISHRSQSEINKLLKSLSTKKIETYEADLKPHYRFLIDNNLLGVIEIKGDYESSEKINRIYQEPEIKALSEKDYKPNLKIASIDIESDWTHKNLFCIGIYSEDFKEVFMITDKKLKSVVPCKDEYECLQKFREKLIDLDPDIITGWNLIDFDLQFLKKKFEEHKIPFDLGRDNSQSRLRIESGFFKNSTADFSGRQVLDGLNFIKDPFIKEAPTIKNAEFETYTLEDVSQAILKQGKKIKGKDRHDEIENLYNSGKHQELADYNLQDCKLVYEILEKTKMIELSIERAMLTGMPLDRITASIAAFDSLYIREARSRGLVSPTNVFNQKEEKLKGGYVMDSKAGIYHNVLVLDFKSLYPSIIKTFNIDPASHLDKKEKGSIESPNKTYFKNQEGILPEIIEKLHQAREKAKKEKRELSSYAIKIIMNSFWGVLASPNCRYFNFEMASAITGFARYIIQLTAKKIEEEGYKVIYSDTDSVFIDTDLGEDKANLLGIKIQDYINDFYKDFIKNEYKRNSYLELQFEKQYLAFLLPAIRGSEAGSKKRYAGLKKVSGEEKIEVVGLEAIRGDWTDAAREFQLKLLDKIFHREEFSSFIKKYVEKIKSGEMDDKLVYKKSITKSLDKYTKTTPPHVKAARKLDSLDSKIIQYIITVKGPEPIQKIENKIDYEHYIEKQIKPIANTILFFFKKDFEEIINSSKQTKLFQ